MIKYISKVNPRLLRGTALLRLDFNTKDDWRMRAVLPTVRLLGKNSTKMLIVSHYGRPTPGKFDKKFTLKNDAVTLARLLHRPVTFIPHFRFGEVKKILQSAPRHSIFLLENLRFLKGEEINSSGLAKTLASLADFYVNDAFAVSHRANASVEAITRFLPSYGGLELENEIVSLSRAMVKPKHPMVVVLGGAKAADKLGVMKYFKNKADWFLLGGGPADTILWMNGMDVKRSVRDTDPKSLKALASLAKLGSIVLPVDFHWNKNAILDIGPKTIKEFEKKIAHARTILWSGPLGVFEKPKYARGGILVARAIARNRRAYSVAGGGETVMFLKRYKLDKKFSFISTGGGAMMDFLAGEKLPGVEALK